MKRFKLFLALAAMATCSVQAAESVEFTRLSFDEGAQLGSTYLAEAPFAVLNGEDFYFDNPQCTVYILSQELTVVHSFTINLKENAVIKYLEWINDGSYLSQVRASQHLFNNDDLYEVVVREDGTYKIYNELGEYLGDCPSYSLTEINGTPYLYDDEYYVSGTDYTSSCLYAINKAGSNVRMFKNETSNLNIFPNPAENDATVTVNAGDFGVEGNTLSVFDVKGTLLFKHVFENGENMVSIPSYKLSVGVNPVVVINSNGDIVATGKAVKK